MVRCIMCQHFNINMTGVVKLNHDYYLGKCEITKRIVSYYQKCISEDNFRRREI